MLISLWTCFIVSFIVSFFFIGGNLSRFYLISGRYSVTSNFFKSTLSPENRHYGVFFGSLIFSIAIMNLLGNVPGVSIPALYYFFSSTLSGVCWLSLVVLIVLGRLNYFISHILPYGSPVGLYLFLPIVELFSQLIRPLTLMIRLSTNLAAGHIILYMFSFFSLSSIILTFSCSLVLGLLFILELVISILQAYIFSTLIYLYISETL